MKNRRRGKENKKYINGRKSGRIIGRDFFLSSPITRPTSDKSVIDLRELRSGYTLAP